YGYPAQADIRGMKGGFARDRPDEHRRRLGIQLPPVLDGPAHDAIEAREIVRKRALRLQRDRAVGGLLALVKPEGAGVGVGEPPIRLEQVRVQLESPVQMGDREA